VQSGWARKAPNACAVPAGTSPGPRIARRRHRQGVGPGNRQAGMEGANRAEFTPDMFLDGRWALCPHTWGGGKNWRFSRKFPEKSGVGAAALHEHVQRGRRYQDQNPRIRQRDGGSSRRCFHSLGCVVADGAREGRHDTARTDPRDAVPMPRSVICSTEPHQKNRCRWSRDRGRKQENCQPDKSASEPPFA